MRTKKLPEQSTLDNLNRIQHEAYQYIDRYYNDKEPKKVNRKVFKNKRAGQIGGPEVLDIRHRLIGKL